MKNQALLFTLFLLSQSDLLARSNETSETESDSTGCESRQSPINIDTENVVEVQFPGFLFKSYGIVTSDTELNKEGEKELKIMFSTFGTVSGGGLTSEYILRDYEFHWGKDDTDGSEHTIDGTHYPLELQLIYERHGMNSSEAQNTVGGITIFSMLFNTTGHKNHHLTSGPWSRITEAIKQANETKPEANDLDLIKLLPVYTSKYYRYYGSLTSSPFSESVIWTVFEQIQAVPEETMKAFRALKQKEAGSSRNVQAQNGRMVWKNVQFPLLNAQFQKITKLLNAEKKE